MQARRDAVRHVRINASTHVGLWLDCYLTEQNNQRDKADKSGEGEKANHIKDVENRPVPAGYREAFDRWCKDLTREDGAALTLPIEATGRIALGLGNKGVLENGLHLDYTWGVPVIPGTALKGLTAAAAHQLAADPEWRKGEKAHSARGTLHAALFGQGGAGRDEASDCIGRVRFLDAWWIPRNAKGQDEARLPIHLDTMTVHHADYYQQKVRPGEREPALPLDTDSPNPVPFATISGRYLLALELTDPTDDAGWLDVALQLLQKGLTDLGLGAKTNAGYGRMALTLPGEKARETQRKFARSQQPGEVAWPAENAAILEASQAEQQVWLLEHGSTLPEGFRFTRESWVAFLHLHFGGAINALRQGPAAVASAGDALQEELDSFKDRLHALQQSKAGKSPKEKDKINKDIDKLEKQRDNLARRLKNLAADAERDARAAELADAPRQAFLAWLDGGT